MLPVFWPKTILGDRFPHDTKKISLVSTSTVFPLSLLGNY